MNKIISKFLLTEDRFMHLPGFTYSACGQFTNKKTNTKIQRCWRFEIYLSKRTR